MKRLLYHLIFVPMLLLALASSAQISSSDYAVMVNGSPLDRVVSVFQISTASGVTGYYLNFQSAYLYWTEDNGDNHFIELHPLQVQLLFGDAIASGINGLRLYDGGEAESVLSLDGLPAGTPVAVYNSAGRLYLSVRAGSGTSVLNIDALPRGVYIAKAGSKVFKFNKK